MAKTQSKKRLLVIIIALLVVALAVAGAVVAKNLNTPTETTTDTSQESTDVTDSDASTDTDTEPAPKPDTSVTPAVDPATLSSVVVEPLGVTVFYSKGVPGFDFVVKRTAAQTQYVEFSTAALVGTKCTDDEGVFASIIKNPGDNERQTTTQIIQVGNDTYGLTLAGAGCTADAALLTEYQTAFTNGFKSLTTL